MAKNAKAGGKKNKEKTGSILMAGGRITVNGKDTGRKTIVTGDARTTQEKGR